MRARREPVWIADRWALAAAVALSLFGIAMIYSAGELDVPSAVTGIWRKQILWFLIALAALVLTARVEVRWLEWVTPVIYTLAILSLVLVLLIGTGNGPRSWIRFGGIGFQPAEVAKLGTVLMLGRISANRSAPPEHLFDLWPYVGVVFVPFALVMAQPDLGTAGVFLAILVAAIFWSGLPLSKLVLILSPLVSLALAFSTALWGVWFLLLVGFIYLSRPYLAESLVTVVANIAMGVLVRPAWRGLAAYQRDRILAFLQPEADPQGAGWHLIQSQVAIGSGGWFGKGFTLGTQKRLAFLPEQHTDFIIAVVGEEMGFVGILAVLCVVGLLLWRVARVAERTPDAFGSMVAFGIFACWFAHLVANVGMTVGLLPITGLPFPFLSYGGSFLVVSFVLLGILQRVTGELRGGT